jgi:hypothetical protein
MVTEEEMRQRNPFDGDRTINKGVKVYQEWHAKDPSDIVKIKVPHGLPNEVASVGKALQIAYRSGKWKKGNSTDDYEHDTKSSDPPTIYHETGDGRVRAVSSFLKNDVIVHLGECLEIIGEDLDGEPLEIDIGKKLPKLVCTSDYRTLIILHKEGPIFINGGTMKVTERGIVD